MAISDMFISSKDFYINYLLNYVSECNDSKGNWFEHILYKSIKKAMQDSASFKYNPLPIALSQIGFSGSTGKFMQPVSIYWQFRNLMSFVKTKFK